MSRLIVTVFPFRGGALHERFNEARLNWFAPPLEKTRPGTLGVCSSPANRDFCMIMRRRGIPEECGVGELVPRSGGSARALDTIATRNPREIVFISSTTDPVGDFDAIVVD